VLEDADVIARPGFSPTIADLLQRMRQGRTYANLHTTAFPGGEVRGQIIVTDREPVPHYSDPEFSWKNEVAPRKARACCSERTLELSPTFKTALTEDSISSPSLMALFYSIASKRRGRPFTNDDDDDDDDRSGHRRS
jgi:hypothetical protein